MWLLFRDPTGKHAAIEVDVNAGEYGDIRTSKTSSFRLSGKTDVGEYGDIGTSKGPSLRPVGEQDVLAVGEQTGDIIEFHGIESPLPDDFFGQLTVLDTMSAPHLDVTTDVVETVRIESIDDSTLNISRAQEED